MPPTYWGEGVARCGRRQGHSLPTITAAHVRAHFLRAWQCSRAGGGRVRTSTGATGAHSLGVKIIIPLVVTPCAAAARRGRANGLVCWPTTRALCHCVLRECVIAALYGFKSITLTILCLTPRHATLRHPAGQQPCVQLHGGQQRRRDHGGDVLDGRGRAAAALTRPRLVERNVPALSCEVEEQLSS